MHEFVVFLFSSLSVHCFILKMSFKYVMHGNRFIANSHLIETEMAESSFDRASTPYFLCVSFIVESQNEIYACVIYI